MNRFLARTHGWTTLALGICLALAPTVVAQSAPGKKSASTASGPALLAEDKGRFRILLDGQAVGSEEFEISRSGADWTARGSTEVRMPSGGAATRVTARLELTPNGTPLRYEWSTQSQKKASATVEFRGGTAKVALQLEGAQPFVQELSFGSPRVIVLDNNLYHQYALLARLYDWKAKGAQTFPVLIPQEMTPGNIAVEALGPQSVEGATLELLRVRTSDLEINLYLDSSHRLVRLSVPSSKVVIVRE